MAGSASTSAPAGVALIRARRTEARGLFTLELRVLDMPDPAWLEAARRPGRYLRLGLRDAEARGYFAMARAPTTHDGSALPSAPSADAAYIEILLKEGSPLADALIQAPPETPLEISLPLGPGYDLDSAQGRDLLLVATGSGISPVRSVILDVLGRRTNYGRVVLVWGAREPDAFAYADEQPLWERTGVELHRVVSSTSVVEEWRGKRGRVQQHLPELEPGRSSAYLCGQNAMIDDVRRLLEARGWDPRRVHTNF